MISDMFRLFRRSHWITDEDGYNLVDQMTYEQVKNLICVFTAAGLLAFLTFGYTMYAGWSLINFAILLLICIIMCLLHAMLLQISATHTWQKTARLFERGLNDLTQEYQRLADTYVRESILVTAVAKIPDGWMSAYGVMNVSRHNEPSYTGPVCFLWKPDLVLKDGKREARCVTGYADTLPEAIFAAIKKAGAYDEIPL